MPPKKAISPTPAPGAPPSGGPGTVRVQKRQPPEAPPLREKLCATCGATFQLTPDQKFFLCPACYRKTFAPVRKPPRKTGARVLIQIRCAACGAEEYLDFVPADPATTYCRACFAKRRRDSKE